MSAPSRIARHPGLLAVACLAVFALTAAVGRSDVAGQGRGRGGGPPMTAVQAAPVDLTGTWVSIVTEDWRWRMVTPPVGDTASIPVSGAGRKAAASWDPAADTAGGDQGKAFGVGGLTRQPGRVRISWQDDETLKLEFDAGTQTRLLHVGDTPPPSGRSLQGFSAASWEGPGVGALAAGDGRRDPRVTGGGLLSREVPGGGGGGLRGGPPPRQQAEMGLGGNMQVVTTQMSEGYLRANGVPYSEQATVTEYIHSLPTHPNGDEWLHIITVVEDPVYLTQPFYTSTSFLREPDDSKFDPRPCETPAPLPTREPAR
jgi:hypothetical protein